MAILEDAKTEFIQVSEKHGVDRNQEIGIRPLSVTAAVGDQLTDEFPIKRGKEQVIEATYQNVPGQAFTDQPLVWRGSLAELLELDLTQVRHRGVFVAGMNAVLASLGLVAGAVHCRDDEPFKCGVSFADTLAQEYGRKRYGLVGLQPAMLKNLVERFGRDAVRAVDLNPDNIGQEKCGINIWDGNTDLPKLVEWCEIGLATGSSVVNGTIDGVKQAFDDASKPVIFFGNTISGTAMLLGLRRFCPFGR